MYHLVEMGLSIEQVLRQIVNNDTKNLTIVNKFMYIYDYIAKRPREYGFIFKILVSNLSTSALPSELVFLKGVSNFMGINNCTCYIIYYLVSWGTILIKRI